MKFSMPSLRVNLQMLSRTIFFIVALLLISTGSFSQGNLLVTPRRIVFEGSKQSQEITIANTGSDSARYNVSFLQYRMTDDGSIEQITEPDSGQYFADKYLRVFPRSIRLAPNESQVIRMQFRKTADMKEGEYRSHLYFRSVPNEKPLGEEDTDTTSIGIRLTPIFGITIPVIARVGNLQSTIEIKDLKFVMTDDTIPSLTITFARQGNKSLFGDIIVNWISPEGKSSEVGTVRGIAVYTPNKNRYFTMKLRHLPDVDYNKGKLLVIYKAPADMKNEVFTQSEVKL